MSWPEKSKQTLAHRQKKKKNKNDVTVTVTLACDIVAAAECSKRFSESDQSAYQETSV